MRRQVAVLVAAAIPAAGAVGPSYRPAAPAPAEARAGTVRRADSTQRFFDSLAAARAADPVRREAQLRWSRLVHRFLLCRHDSFERGVARLVNARLDRQ